MDNPRSRPQASISVPGLPPWMKNTLQKFMQEGQTHIKSVSSTLHKLGGPGTKGTATSTEASEPKPLDFRVKLEKQLQAWRENNQWVDPTPKIEVTVPKGSLCHLDATTEVGLPPDAVFDIVIDPDNKNVFKNIKEVKYRKILEDEGHRQLVEVEQAAIWRFLWWSGTISVRVFVEQDRRNHTSTERRKARRTDCTTVPLKEKSPQSRLFHFLRSLHSTSPEKSTERREARRTDCTTVPLKEKSPHSRLFHFLHSLNSPLPGIDWIPDCLYFF